MLQITGLENEQQSFCNSPLQHVSNWNFWLSRSSACIFSHRSQVIEQSTRVSEQVSGITVSQGYLESHPKTSNIFQSPPAAQVLISAWPQWPHPHMHFLTLLSGEWRGNLSASPGAPATWRTDLVGPKQPWDSVGGAVMMLRGHKHVQGADFFHFLHISQKTITHSRHIQKRWKSFTSWETITHIALIVCVHIHINSQSYLPSPNSAQQHKNTSKHTTIWKKWTRT